MKNVTKIFTKKNHQKIIKKIKNNTIIKCQIILVVKIDNLYIIVRIDKLKLITDLISLLIKKLIGLIKGFNLKKKNMMLVQPHLFLQPH